MESTKDSKNRRRKYFIHFQFQFQFLLFMIGLAALSILFFYAIEMYYLKNIFANQTDLCGNDQRFWYTTSQIKKTIDLIFIVKSGVIFTLLSLAGLIYSHHIVGPLYKIRKHMKETMQGQTPPKITFRNRDYFHELASEYNRLIDYLTHIKNNPKK